MQSIFPYLSALWPLALLGACVKNIFTLISLCVAAGMWRSAALCFATGCINELLKKLVIWVAILFAFDRGAIDLQELQKDKICGCDIKLPNQYSI